MEKVRAPMGQGRPTGTRTAGTLQAKSW